MTVLSTLSVKCDITRGFENRKSTSTITKNVVNSLFRLAALFIRLPSLGSIYMALFLDQVTYLKEKIVLQKHTFKTLYKNIKLKPSSLAYKIAVFESTNICFLT